jgi:RHS repeat-associated protein
MNTHYGRKQSRTFRRTLSLICFCIVLPLLWSGHAAAVSPEFVCTNGTVPGAHCTDVTPTPWVYSVEQKNWDPWVNPNSFASLTELIETFRAVHLAAVPWWCAMSLSHVAFDSVPGPWLWTSSPIYEDGIEVRRQHHLTFDITERSDQAPACATTFGYGRAVLQDRTLKCPVNYTRIYEAGPPTVGPYCALPWDWMDPEVNVGLSCGPEKGNPCQIGSGNKVQRELDYVGPGPLPLKFERYYNSLVAGWYRADSRWRPLGVGWSGTYLQKIERTAIGSLETAFAYRPDGRRLSFNASGLAFTPPPDVEMVLQAQRDTAGTITGWTLTTEHDETETYDASGRLLSIQSREGVIQTLQYNVAGLESVTDSFGRQLQFVFAANGRLSSIETPDGNTVQYAYSGQDLVQVTHEDATTRQYHYEIGWNFLTGITDERAMRHSTYGYNNSTGLLETTELAGGVNKYTIGYYTAGPRIVTDPLNVQRYYDFSTVLNKPRLLSSPSVCAGCSEPKAATYDANGNASSRTDFNNIQTTYAYGLARNLETSRTEAHGTPRARTVTTQWHSTFRLPTQIDEPGKRTTFTRDTDGNVLTKTVLDTATSASRTWTYTYNGFGQVLTADGPRTDVSDVTTYTYYTCTTGYQCGQVNAITNAAGHVTTYNTYNAHGQPLTITDSNGLVTTLTYDARQRLTSRTIGSEQTIFAYWPTGLLKKATLPDGSYLQYSHDAAHRLTEIEDSEGNRIVYTLDNMGNRTAEQVYDPSNALTQTRTRVFNTLNQLWKEIGAAGSSAVTTTFSYDNDGNQTGIAAPLSRNTTQAYDELDRLTQVTDPLSGITQYGYNPLDELISVTDPRSKITSYTYNALGDLTQQVSPDTGTTTNTYDSGGNLATSTDARSKTATYAYDALNRVTSVTYPDQTIGYSHDSGTNQKGRLTQVTDASGSTSWTYDTHGRVLSRQQSMDVTKTLGYAYDSFGRLQTLTLPSGNTITYGYTDGKVTSLTLNGSTTILSNVLYEPFGPTRGWTWGNSSLAIREYDTDGKVTDIDSAGLKTYSYDDAFRITGIADAANSSLSQGYGYDLLDRLTSATGTGLNQGWTYDANGNRLTQTGGAASTYTISSTSNRLSSVSGALSKTYSYDNSGSTTSDGTATFTYNDAGRMVSATKASVTATYALNALGQRVKKTTSGASTYFAYDEAGHLVGEYDNSGNLIQETVWFGDAPVATLRPNGGGVNLFYVHTDHLNTPRRISRPTDNVIVWRWDSDPFGTTVANEDPDGDSNLFSFHLRFPGQYFDEETGLHYNYFRDYDPQTGRYPQSDPLGLKGGLNTYAYVHANPLRYSDPKGLDSRAEPRPCIGCWPFAPPTKRPPGGWHEEEFAKDVWDGLKNICKAIVGDTDEEARCRPIYKGCQRGCTDIFVDDPDGLPGSGTDFAGRLRRCIRECMEAQGCFNY